MSSPSRKGQDHFPTVLARQQAFNRRTRHNGALFEAHRRRVTAAIVQSSQRTAGLLCVLGAGNANDLDLPVLAGAFEQIHLVDLDSEALREAVDGLPELDSVVRLHGGIELSGIAKQLDGLGHPRRAEQIDELITTARKEPSFNLPRSCDVVASTCLLTQLMNAAVAAVGPSEHRLLEFLAAIRIGHLRLLASLVTPGGKGLLFTDIASSDESPEVATTSEPARLAANLARQNKLFVGVAPQQIEDDLRGDPLLAPQVESLTRIGVWPWRISETRTFLVSGISFQTAPDPNRVPSEP